MQIRFTVNLDSGAFGHASDEAIQAEIDRLTDILNDETYVSQIEVIS